MSPPELVIRSPPPRHCDELQLNLSMMILFKLNDDFDLMIMALKVGLNIDVGSAVEAILAYELTKLMSVKLESVMEIAEADETRNPEFVNSFYVNLELFIVTELNTADKNTILEESTKSPLGPTTWPEMLIESTCKTDYIMEMYSPTPVRFSTKVATFASIFGSF